jgi:hypothetical protein
VNFEIFNILIKGKEMLTLCFFKHHTMNTYREAEVNLQAFLNLALDECEQPASWSVKQLLVLI